MATGLESSLWYSVITTVSAILIGGGLAMAERLWQQAPRRWFTAVMLLPVFLPPVIITTSFIATFGTAGLLPLGILYTPWAVLLGYGYYNIPLAYLLVRSALNRLSSANEAAAQVLGANRWQRFYSVLLPPLRLPLLGTASLIFLYCFTSFILPLQLGGSYGQTSEVWLYQQIYLHHHYAAAVSLAIVQCLMIMVMVLPILWLQPRWHVPQFVPQSIKPTAIPIAVWRYLLAGGVLLPLSAWLIRLMRTVAWPDVVNLLASDFFMALGRSLVIAIVTIAISLLLVLILRLGRTTAILLLALSPITVSFIWYQWFGKGYISLLGASTMLVLPITAWLIQQARRQYSDFILPTAKLLGANGWQRLHLEWGLLQPTLRQVMLFGSILLIGDATISAQLAPAAGLLAMPYALQLIGNYRFPIGSLALLMIMACISLIVSVAYARRS